VKFVYDDGGRKAAGFKGKADDCIVRAIAIAAEKPYREVYYALNAHRGVRGLVKNNAARRYLKTLGWEWTPILFNRFLDKAHQVHLRADELPSGRLIVALPHHLVAVIDGVAYDTLKGEHGSRRLIEGYFKIPKNPKIRRLYC
jgi:hypothetical protein